MQSYPGIRALLAEWREDARTLREKHHDERGALLYEDRARDLERAIREDGEAPLTLKEASEFSGYSVAQLGRLIREGALQNVGRPNQPRVRRGDLPLKGSRLRRQRPQTNMARTRIVSAVVNSYGGSDGH